jgi:hypothetical protein
MPKASKVVNVSWQFGRIAHWENRFLRRARNFALRSTPARIRQRQLDELFTAQV